MNVVNDNLASEVRAVFPEEEIQKDGMWLRVRMDRLAADAAAGWKLHLSSTPAGIGELLREALPVLDRLGLPFKIVRSVEALEELNDGRYGLTQVGKAVTVYPPDESSAAAAAAALREVLKKANGPAIPTDFPVYNDAPIYCRFGPFDARLTIDALGRGRRLLLHPELGDVIDPADGGDAPLPEPALLPRGDVPDHLKFLRGRFLFLRMLHLTAKGGVFLAMSRNDRGQTPVLIKTARAGTNSDRYGRDALWAMTREHNFLQLLAEVPGVPEAGELLRGGEDAMAIVRPWLDGNSFWEQWTRPDAATPPSRRALVHKLADLAGRIASIHRRGIIMRDLSPGNILFTSGGGVILDWEMAQWASESIPGYRRGTPGFYDLSRDRFAVPVYADDRVALLSLAFMAESGVHPALLPVGALTHRVTAVSCAVPFRATLQRLGDIEVCDANFELTYRELASEAGNTDKGAFAEPDCVEWEGGLRNDIYRTLDVVERIGCGHEDVTVYSGLSGLLLTAIEYAPERILGSLPPERLLGGCARMLDLAAAVRHIPGLYFGESGVVLASAVTAAYLNAPHLLKRTEAIFSASETVESVVPDICHGLAGHSLAALAIWRVTDAPVYRECALRDGERLVTRAVPSDQGIAWPWPEGPYGSLSGARLPGFAHGAAGVVYALTSLYEAFGVPRFRTAAEQGLDSLAHHALPLADGGCWWAFSAEDDTCWNAWCHGTPGIVKALSRAIQVFGRGKDRELLRRALKGVASANNAGFCLCHGIASRLDAWADAREWLEETQGAAQRDAAILANLDGYALETLTHGLESSGRSRGLMTGAAGIFRTLAKFTGELRGPFGRLLP